MKFFKKNQVLIYVIALMLVTAGYLSYTSSEHDINSTIQTTTSTEELAGTKNLGDAQLASTDTSMEDFTNETSYNSISSSANSTENNTNSTENTTTGANNVVNNAGTNTAKENNETIETSSEQTKSDYFTKSKLERDTMYSQMLETYEKVLNGINSLETQKQSATEEIKKINDTKNSIMITENLITTKGFKNNIIFVNGDSISAIIGADELKQEEIAQIQNIISRELNAKIENIHIALK